MFSNGYFCLWLFLKQYIHVYVYTQVHVHVCTLYVFIIFNMSLWTILIANHWVYPWQYIYNNWLQKEKGWRRVKENTG